MKAVLIFNIEGTTIDDLRLYAIPSIESVSGKEIKATSDLVLRPLPSKLNETELVFGEIHGYRGGWNDCLEDILGETE